MKTLADIGIKAKYKTFIIAEIGINHGGDHKLAFKLIDSAVKTGADAVKFQTYITEKRTFVGSPIFDILKKCELPLSCFKELKEYSESKGIIFFSTPFDKESFYCLKEINCELYKIASFDVVNYPFLKLISSSEKTIIMSIGMSNLEEISKAYEILCDSTQKIAMLHCISAYPTNEKDANLAAIHTLINNFPSCVIGQSDHTTNIKVPLYAVAAGARIIEKHYMISPEMNCVDASVSITEKKMSRLVNEVRKLEAILGDGTPELTESQKGTVQFRRIHNVI